MSSDRPPVKCLGHRTGSTLCEIVPDGAEYHCHSCLSYWTPLSPGYSDLDQWYHETYSTATAFECRAKLTLQLLRSAESGKEKYTLLQDYGRKERQMAAQEIRQRLQVLQAGCTNPDERAVLMLALREIESVSGDAKL